MFDDPSNRTCARKVSVVISSVWDMSVALASAPVLASPIDPLCVRLDAMLSELADAVAVCAGLRDVGEVSDAERIDRISRLEQLKAAAGALQAAESVRFAQSQVAHHQRRPTLPPAHRHHHHPHRPQLHHQRTPTALDDRVRLSAFSWRGHLASEIMNEGQRGCPRGRT
jgi:hypothetical protein